MISGNMIGGTAPIKTVKIVDEDGVEILGVVVDQEQIFTATDNDVRAGSVYAGDSGVSTGTKDIPPYHTTEGERVITNGSKFVITIPNYDYTKLQAIICSFNTSLDNSVSAEQIVVNDNVYDVHSTDSLSVVQKDGDNLRIDLGITNTSGNIYLIRYITYKEIY